MADIRHLVGEVRPPAVDPPETQLRDAIRAAGITPPTEIHLDGQLHRFRSGTKGTGVETDKAGWYVAFGDGVPAGRFGCWRAGIEQPWVADVGRPLSDVERMAHARRMAEAQAARDAARERLRTAAADTAEAIWAAASAASADHPYLARKGVQPHGARIASDGRLIVPLYHPDGRLSSIQYIAADGGKLYHAGGQTGGCCSWTLGVVDGGVVYVAEGFATGATIHESTGRPCAVAYSASNLVPVVGSLRVKWGPALSIVVVADNDASGVGQRYAEQAAVKYGARVVVPPEPGDVNDYRQRGGDVALLLDPPADEWLIPAADFAREPAPIRWLVKRWLQAEALAMIHGPPGGGKTFLALDLALHVASGAESWMGQRVHPCPVVYLAGEGHHGLRSRVAAWMQHHQATDVDMWLSRDGCDLNAPAGYQRVREAIRALPRVPGAIIVDTLHRFLFGDENSAQDAKTMIDACGALMREFRCAVVLIHHTGVAEDAQHRARGSSAWRGALEIEISVVPPKAPGGPIHVVQRKAKDAELAEPLWLELERVEISGWIDEDGEPVASAVLSPTEAPATPAKRGSKVDAHRKRWERAWWAGGAEVHDGRPYLTRSALRDLLLSDGLSPRSAENAMKPSDSRLLIGALLDAEIIAAYADGWVMIAADADVLILRKNAG